MWNRIKLLKHKFRYDDTELPFLEHLDAFRSTFIKILFSLIVGIMICIPFADDLIYFLRIPADPYIQSTSPDNKINIIFSESSFSKTTSASEDIQINAEGTILNERSNSNLIRLQFSEPISALKMWLLVSFFGGLILSFPFIAFFLALFIMPGIRDIEQKAIRKISFFSGFLFLLGVLIGYKITLPLALDLMLRISGTLGGESIWLYSKYILFTLQLLFAFGLSFQLPIIILILGKMNIINSYQLRKKRRHVIIGLLILAMLLTPPDLMTQLLLAIPLILLYEFCVWFLYFSNKKSNVEENKT